MVSKKKLKAATLYGVILAVCAAIGVFSSFSLLHETFAVAKDPSYSPSCNVNPLVSCASAMSSEQGEILGIPNPAFGIAAFTALFTFAVLLVSGEIFKRWVWRAGLVAATGGLAFALYLYSTAMFVLGSICPWCFVTWVIVVAIFWAFVTYTLREKVLTPPGWLKPVTTIWVNNAGLVLAILYAALIFGLLIRFHEALFV
jgi:uncharacterized membrane protein